MSTQLDSTDLRGAADWLDAVNTASSEVFAPSLSAGAAVYTTGGDLLGTLEVLDDIYVIEVKP